MLSYTSSLRQPCGSSHGCPISRTRVERCEVGCCSGGTCATGIRLVFETTGRPRSRSELAAILAEEPKSVSEAYIRVAVIDIDTNAGIVNKLSRIGLRSKYMNNTKINQVPVENRSQIKPCFQRRHTRPNMPLPRPRKRNKPRNLMKINTISRMNVEMKASLSEPRLGKLQT